MLMYIFAIVGSHCPTGATSALGLICGPGTYSDVSRISSCKQCQSPFYGSTAGLTSSSCSGICISNNSYCLDGATSKIGFYSSCASGKYSLPSWPLFTICLDCVAGSFSSSGSTTCVECVPGSYSLNGWSNCESCEPGKYSLFGYSSCLSCSGGSYSSTRFSSYCLDCSGGRWSSIGSSSCLLCSGIH